MKLISRLRKGEISIMTAIIAAVGTVIAATVTGYVAQSKAAKIEIDESRKDVYAVVERVAKLEEAVTTIKSDNAEIKRDIKEILKRLPK